MATEWSEGIVLAQLGDEPELSEELSGVYARFGGQDREGEPAHVVLNFTGVTYLNSSHIASLLRLRKRVHDAGKKLILCSVNDQIWSMILLTGLDKVFTFSPDPATALASVRIDNQG